MNAVPRVRVYVHPTCYSSYRLVKGLAEQRLLDRVELVDTSRHPLHALSEGVWSVPWVTVDGVPVATDPVTVEEVAAIIRGEGLEVSVDPVEAFMEAVLHSAYATAVALVYGSVKPVVEEGFVSAALRAPLRGLNPSKLAAELAARLEEVPGQWLDKLVRAAGVSLVRELWWGSQGALTLSELRSITPRTVAAWLLAKASVGRVGLPPNPLEENIAKIASRIASFVQRGAVGLVNKVRKEWEEIVSDKDYQKLLENRALAP